MQQTVLPVLPIFLFLVCALGLALGLLAAARIFNPGRPGQVKRMPYESGMDPIHDTRRRFDVRFYLLAIAFLVFDVELLFLYPWAVAAGQRVESGEWRVESGEWRVESPASLAASQVSDAPRPSSLVPLQTSRHLVFAGVMTFVALLTIGFVYDWRKGIFQWR